MVGRTNSDELQERIVEMEGMLAQFRVAVSEGDHATAGWLRSRMPERMDAMNLFYDYRVWPT